MVPPIRVETDTSTIAGFTAIDAVEGNNVIGIETEISVEPKKRLARCKRRLWSAVWGHFELLPSGKDGRQRCKCRNCGTSYLYDSKFGTGNMKRHLRTCLKRESWDVGQLLLTHYNSPILPFSGHLFDHERFRQIFLEAVVRHGLAFQFVEWAGIRDLLLYLCPDLQLGTRTTVGDDCVAMYIREKVKMQAKLQATSNWISLTYDLYSSLTTDSYGCLTVYFIDNDWNLQKNVLNFFYLPPPYCNTYLAEKIFGLLIDWGIEKKVSTITLNSALINADPVKDLRSKLNASRGLFCGGEYFHFPCCAHIINVIVQDGLKEIDETLHKIRESVKFVKGSKAREQKFLECVIQSSLDVKKGLRQDVSTVWSSTLIMLHHALYYRQAFMQLEISDSSYNACPSKNEWDNLEKITELLSVFYDIALLFSRSKYPTANLFFPAIFSAYLRLKQETGNDDECLKTLSMRLLSKLEKYWSDFSIILAIGVVLDPRYKFSFVDWCFKKLLGDDGVQESTRVKEKLFSLFTMYTTPTKFLPSPKPTIMPDESCYNDQFNSPDDSFSREADDFFKEFDSLAREDAFQQKSQMELYLDEPRINRKSRLDVPTYWKVNQYRFPEVAAMARDILSIPFTTVNKENIFDENGRMLDQYNSALNPDMIEALICTRDWLYGENEAKQLMLEELTKDIFLFDVDD